MLKALELAGFKSFADKTKFEFPRGVSVVVGPNGSGKSNVVDAVKWVLGSQSAKSLRGKEMTDVIFNGAPSRGPLGTAEATLTFDNGERLLPIDSTEIHVTRRVFRSGESEYLINRQPCRLRDIKDLLAGTGITTEAYCIIEQGKVDALLQSSPRERRIIFEEAAGISQFKLKKVAAMRRLERVEQNLLRLSDIVDEVESRLRSVRSQAGKARRYRENARRLELLRKHLGLVDWRASSAKLAATNTDLETARRHLAELEQAVEGLEGSLAKFGTQLESGDAALRNIEVAASVTRERIAAREASLVSLAKRHADLEQDNARICRLLLALTHRGEDGQPDFGDAESQLRSAEAESAASSTSYAQLVRQCTSAEERINAIRGHCERLSEQHDAVSREIRASASHAAEIESKLLTARSEHSFSASHVHDLDAQREAKLEELATLSAAESLLEEQLESCNRGREEADQRLAIVRRDLTRLDKQQREQEGHLGRIRERISLLSELESRLEGIDNSVREIVQHAEAQGLSSDIDLRGIVADLLHVDVDTAPLVEIALGEKAQFLVLSSPRIFEWLANARPVLNGRVGFLRLDTRTVTTALDHVDLTTEPGVMGRADRFVDSAPEVASLVHRLLGHTWFVDRLTTALRLAQGAGRGLQFVTSDFELLAPDGTLVIGSRQSASRILSRRSELRACREQAAEIQKQLEIVEQTQAKLQAQCAKLEELRSGSDAIHAKLTAAHGERRKATIAAETRLAAIDEQLAQFEGRARAARGAIEDLESQLSAIETDGSAKRTLADSIWRDLESQRAELENLEGSYHELRTATSERQIALAKCEQRVVMLKEQIRQTRRNQQERSDALIESKRQIIASRKQVEEIEGAMLVDRQIQAELYLQKEEHAIERHRVLSSDATLRRERDSLTVRVRDERRRLATAQNHVYKLEVSAGKIAHDLETLRGRIQDDFGIDLTTEAPRIAEELERLQSQSPECAITGSRAEVEQEIAVLRDQLNSIGAVNLDALEELDELEARFGSLSAQYRDLVEAKSSLERIVQRINGDSRQIFLATLEVVRGHFQELFRRLFGGGEADIVIDDADDVLECGIEIIARPPGKEKCSISLLSGGEKTLTCVALLLAVFRSKPSPFCVLDEVDAALDEANIGRFIQVLREFLSFTQFIVVSHSKRTMSGADTLYGVTMEESGISKRVSVRFEDVGEDGHILPSAFRRADASSDVETAEGRKAA